MSDIDTTAEEYCKDCDTNHPTFLQNEDGTFGKLGSTQDDVIRFQIVGNRVIGLLQDEMTRQVNRWGVQNYPSFQLQPNGQMLVVNQPVDSLHGLASEEDAKANTEYRAENGTVTWCDILKEELSEALNSAYKAGDGSGTDDDTFGELVQTVAVGVSWLINLYDQRRGDAVMEQYRQDLAEQQQAQEQMLAFLSRMSGDDDSFDADGYDD